MGLLSGRVVVLAGYGPGLGAALAKRSVEEGAKLVIASRTAEKLDAAAEELRGKGYEVEAVPANMADEDGIKQVVAAHRDKYGRLDVLINNAGVGIGSAIADAETKKLDMQLDVNLRAVYLTLRECIPMLKEAGAEHRKALVVNTASIAGVRHQAWLAAYSATKAGVIALSGAAHGELAGDGIQVTAFCPGFVATPMTDWVKGAVPPADMIQTDDCVAAVRFLLGLTAGCRVPELLIDGPRPPGL